MKSLSATFNQMCEKKYRKKGFVRNRNLFVRQTDDILQVFSLKIFSGGRISTVEFGVVPMCMPLPVFLDAGNYEIHKFCIKNYAEYGGWFLDQKSEASINRCVDELIATVDKYLMPFFNLVIDCKHSLDILLELEETFEKNRFEVLRMRGESDHASPFEKRFLQDRKKYFMALKAHDWMFARKYLNLQVELCKKNLCPLNNSSLCKQPECVRDGLQKSLEQYSFELSRLDAADWAYFDHQVHQNEQAMIAFLEEKLFKHK